MPKITVSDHHADLLVDFFRAQEKELTEKLNGIRTVISELLGDAAKAVAPKKTATKTATKKGGKRGRKPGTKSAASSVAKAAMDLLAKATPKKSTGRGRPKGAKNKSKKAAVATPKVSTGKRGRPAKNAAAPAPVAETPAS